MSDINELYRVIIQDTRQGRCAVCKRGSRECSDVAACAQRSIPPLTKQFELLSCKLCNVRVRGGDYAGHIGACLVLYQRKVEDMIVGLQAPYNRRHDCWPTSPTLADSSSGASEMATSVPPPAKSDRLTTTRLATSASKSRGTIPKRIHETHGRPGKPCMVSLWPQTTKKTCNASTMTKKMTLVPGVAYEFIRWRKQDETHDLLDGISEINRQQAEPLILVPEIRMLDLIDLVGEGAGSLPVNKTSIKGEDIFVELDTPHASVIRGREAAHSEVITDNNTGLGDNIVMEDVRELFESIPVPKIRMIDLIDLGGEAAGSLPVNTTRIKGEDIFVELDTPHGSVIRGREAAHSEVITDNNTGLGDNIVMEVVGELDTPHRSVIRGREAAHSEVITDNNTGLGDNIVMEDVVDDGSVDGRAAADGVVNVESEFFTPFTLLHLQSSHEKADELATSGIGDESCEGDVVEAGTTVDAFSDDLESILTMDVDAAEGAEEDGGSSLDTLVRELFEWMGLSKPPIQAAD